MFYPKLTRKSEEHYHNSGGKFYADYKENHAKISEDCLHRCAYCDVLLIEMGHEGMQLDHFRPQKYFSDLKCHPYNLYLACPKCNRLKSDDWPCERKIGFPSFEGKIGYLDPFEHEPSKYLSVNLDGELVSLDGPIEYMIKRLLLNRPSRTQIRRKRILDAKKAHLNLKLGELLDALLRDMEDVNVNQTRAEFATRLKDIKNLRELIESCI